MVRRGRGRDGMSLVEVLLCIAIVGMLLTTMAFSTFSFQKIWLDGLDGDFFDQHVDGVAAFLNNVFSQAEAVEGTDAPPDGAGGNATSQPVQWGRPPGWSDNDPPLLLFRQKEAPPLFVEEGVRLPDLACYLYFDREVGLSILWFSNLQVEVEDLDDLFRTRVSPFVDRIEYCYYDRENDEWETVDEPQKDPKADEAYRLPQFLRLHFRYQDLERTRLIHVPQRQPELPTF